MSRKYNPEWCRNVFFDVCFRIEIFCHNTDILSVYHPIVCIFSSSEPRTRHRLIVVSRLSSQLTGHHSPGPAWARGPTPTQQRSHKAAELSTARCRLDQSTTFFNLSEEVNKE